MLLSRDRPKMKIIEYLHKILNTIIYLKPIQIYFQLKYRIECIIRRAIGNRGLLLNSISYAKSQGNHIFLNKFIDKSCCLEVIYEASNNSIKNTKFEKIEYYLFGFLNVFRKFELEKIPWNDKKYSKLWAYYLNYMDYLLQSNADFQTNIKLIHQFIDNISTNSIGLEPYPTALRCINWIKFISLNNEQIRKTGDIDKINNVLYTQYKILTRNLEYHLLGNHLLEDGFSLLFGAFYFREITFYRKAKSIINREINEQILDDGAHFELSPMYHQIILDRLLDCINLLQNNMIFDDQDNLLRLMRHKAIKMLKWLNIITFSNCEIPLLNDSAQGIAPTTRELNDYAVNLGIILLENICNSRYDAIKLNQSGYRCFRNCRYECILDIGQIGPAYQPGHAHADTFNFVLNIKDEPFLIDNGISTYEANEIRQREKGTASHNTVTILDKDSSEVWSSFRVGQRANVIILRDDKNHVFACHDGYRKFNTIHKRGWIFNDNQIEIIDILEGRINSGKAHLLLSPEIKPILRRNIVECHNCVIRFDYEDSIKIISTTISNGFNNYSNSYEIEISFHDILSTIIQIL